MTRRLAVSAAAFVLASGAAPSAAAPAKSLTKPRAEAAVAKKVKASYRSLVAGRDVEVGCKRVSARHYRCEYGVALGTQDDVDDQDRNPYRYEGTGSVKQGRSGKLAVRVSRPR